MKLTILIENTAQPGLVCEHGLSVYINYNGHDLLLDCGETDGFLKNAGSLGVDITKAELATLSHGHYDHGDGFPHFLAANRTAPVYYRPAALDEQWLDGEDVGLSEAAIAGLRHRGRRVEKTTMLLPGVWAVPDQVEHEQSLVLEGKDGLVVLNSCCHAGAGFILRDIQQTFRELCPGKPLRALIGGLHLMGLDGPATLGVSPGIVKNLGKWMFDELGLAELYTGHCTGEPALRLLEEGWPDKVRRLTSGLVMEL